MQLELYDITKFIEVPIEELTKLKALSQDFGYYIIDKKIKSIKSFKTKEEADIYINQSETCKYGYTLYIYSTQTQEKAIIQKDKKPKTKSEVSFDIQGAIREIREALGYEKFSYELEIKEMHQCRSMFNGIVYMVLYKDKFDLFKEQKIRERFFKKIEFNPQNKPDKTLVQMSIQESISMYGYIRLAGYLKDSFQRHKKGQVVKFEEYEL